MTHEAVRADRLAAWSSREQGWMAPLRAAGCVPIVTTEISRRCKATGEFDGWFDFWPTTGRWRYTTRGGSPAGMMGQSLISMLGAIEVAKARKA